MVKDNFSDQSKDYQRFRPSYPNHLINLIANLTLEKENALDCGTGNGQLAIQLTGHFKQVFAIDISQPQLDLAVQSERIKYSLQAAEKTSFPDQFFDLITVGQAAHWFDFEKFFLEIDRILKPSGIIALIGYHLLRINPVIDKIIDKFYSDTLGPFWDPERKYVDQRYQNIPFPFDEIKIKELVFTLRWNFPDLIGYLGTWSALKHFIDANNYDPLKELEPALKQHWGPSGYSAVRFPFFTRIGWKIEDGSRKSAARKLKTEVRSQAITHLTTLPLSDLPFN